MPKIAINATITRKNQTGLGVYTYELLLELLKAECNFDFTVYSSSHDLKRLYPDRVAPVSPYTSPALGFRGYLLRLLWQQMILPAKLRKQKGDLFYSPVPEGILIPNLKQIITIHDIIPVRYPEMYLWARYYFLYILPILLRNSQAIICDSEHTRKEIIAYYGIRNKPIYVIYPGFNRERFYPRKGEIVQKRYGLGKYLLYIGDMRPYKNLERSLEAFAGLGLKELKFVVGGMKDPRFYPGLEKKGEELSLKQRVVFLGYVPENDLPHLYSEAAAFIFPSLYEGFGLPPLEAMACGCPVVVSNAASLPEVCGDAAYYVDPYRVDSIAEGMYQVLADANLRKSLVQKGLERAKMFNWEKTAKETLKVFEEVLQS